MGRAVGAAVLCALLVLSAAANQLENKGVHPDQLGQYAATGEFNCFDGSGKIAADQVNDEYCDCSDGSDEPGTSACHNGRFWCKNFGHRGLFVFSSRVNDGVCDCCDGSDEYNGVKVCEDRCAEEGREIKEALMKKIHMQEEDELSKLIVEAEGKMHEVQSRVDELTKVVDAEKEARRPEEEAKRASVEARRSAREEQRNARRAEEDAVKAQMEEAARAAQVEKDAQAGSAEVRPAEDEAGAASADPVAPYEVAAPHDAESGEEGGEEGEGGDDGEGEGEGINGSKGEIDSGYDHAGEAARRAAEDEEDARLRAEEDKELEYPKSEAEEGLAVAEGDLEPHRDDKAKYEKELEGLAKVLEGDFGPDDAYAALYDKCFSQQVQQYTYEVCMFRDAKQKEGGATNIGNWGHWGGADDGRPYSVMHYTGGSSCWNGPTRTLKVALQCGLDEFVVSVQEPSKCVYEMEFQTPLACSAEEVAAAKRELETQYGA